MSATARMMAFLGLDPKDFNKGVDQAHGKVRTFSGALDGMKGKLAAAFSVAAVAAAVKNVADYSGQLADMAENFGVTTDQIQGLVVAAKPLGLELEDVATALSKMTLAQSEFVSGNGSKELAARMEALGISLGDADAMNAAQFFEAVATGATQSAAGLDAALKMLGRSGPRFQAFIKLLSRDGLSGLVESARAGGSLISAGDVAATDAVMDGLIGKGMLRLRKLGASVVGAFSRGVTQSAPMTDDAYAVSRSRQASRLVSEDEKARAVMQDADEIRRKTAFDILSATEKRAALEAEIADIDRQRMGLITEMEYAQLDKQRAELESKLAGLNEPPGGGIVSPNFTALERIGAVGGVATNQSPIPQKTLTVLQKMQADMSALVAYAAKQKSGVF